MQRFLTGPEKHLETASAKNLWRGKAYHSDLAFPTPSNTRNTIKYDCVCGNFLW
jgi:hypothetical protein